VVAPVVDAGAARVCGAAYALLGQQADAHGTSLLAFVDYLDQSNRLVGFVSRHWFRATGPERRKAAAELAATVHRASPGCSLVLRAANKMVVASEEADGSMVVEEVSQPEPCSYGGDAVAASVRLSAADTELVFDVLASTAEPLVVVVVNDSWKELARADRVSAAKRWLDLATATDASCAVRVVDRSQQRVLATATERDGAALAR
jgi:hypothetical protein